MVLCLACVPQPPLSIGSRFPCPCRMNQEYLILGAPTQPPMAGEVMPGSAASCGGHSMLPPAPRALEERPGIVTGEGVVG